VKSEALEHASDLAIDSLFEHDAKSRWRNLPHLLGPGEFSIESNAAQKSLHQICRGGAIQDNVVFLVDFESRMRQALRKIAVTGEDK
jgi:hypothetical protein